MCNPILETQKKACQKNFQADLTKLNDSFKNGNPDTKMDVSEDPNDYINAIKKKTDESKECEEKVFNEA